MTIELSQIPAGVQTLEGIPRPDWEAIAEHMEAHGLDEDPTAWEALTRDWLERLRQGLGGDYRLLEGQRVRLLSDLPEADSQHLLGSLDGLLQRTEPLLLGDAEDLQQVKLTVLAFGEADDHDLYLSWFFPEGDAPPGEQPPQQTASGEVHLATATLLADGLLHLALGPARLEEVEGAAKLEAVRALMIDQPLPIWADEGLAEVLAFGPPDQSQANVASHQGKWGQDRIQRFWSGEAFDGEGDEPAHAHELAAILAAALVERFPQRLAAFVAAADDEDAGRDAAQAALGAPLVELVTGFLGPGDWEPDPSRWPPELFEPLQDDPGGGGE